MMPLAIDGADTAQTATSAHHEHAAQAQHGDAARREQPRLDDQIDQKSLSRKDAELRARLASIKLQ